MDKQIVVYLYYRIPYSNESEVVFATNVASSYYLIVLQKNLVENEYIIYVSIFYKVQKQTKLIYDYRSQDAGYRSEERL